MFATSYYAALDHYSTNFFDHVALTEVTAGHTYNLFPTVFA
jgi:hypothetical protein